MNNDELDRMDSDALPPLEAAQYAALPRTHPISMEREDQLIKALQNQGVVMRSRRFTRRSTVALIAAAAVVFSAGAWAGYTFHPSRLALASVVATSDSSHMQSLATVTLSTEAPPAVSPGGRQLIWF